MCRVNFAENEISAVKIVSTRIACLIIWVSGLMDSIPSFCETDNSSSQKIAIRHPKVAIIPATAARNAIGF